MGFVTAQLDTGHCPLGSKVSSCNSLLFFVFKLFLQTPDVPLPSPNIFLCPWLTSQEGRQISNKQIINFPANQPPLILDIFKNFHLLSWNFWLFLNMYEKHIQGFQLRGEDRGGHSTMEVIPPLVRPVPPPLLGPCPPPSEEFFPLCGLFTCLYFYSCYVISCL